MKKRPRPMGKIFQPEVAARAIYWAATHRRRELWVGWPAVQAILATRIVPGLLDGILGRTAWDGQHTDEPLPAGRKDNLYEPVDGDRGDHGAHGRFDALAHGFSSQLWLTTHRATVALVVVIVLLVLLGVALAVW
ncbi:MAG: short-chain dehydrogenase, partial [Betaproteobacteria bacterium]